MVSFDAQASDFDVRAGLPIEAARQVAAALASMVSEVVTDDPSEPGVLLDLGAGTGQIGAHLVEARCTYLGVDISAPMLGVFRTKLVAAAQPDLGRRMHLVLADGCIDWPIASGSVDLVFVSRAAHLLPPTLLVREILRVANPKGAMAVFGGVRSERDSLRPMLRREMRRLLAEQGIEGRNARAFQDRIARELEERGGEVLPVRAVTSWSVTQTACDALAGWRAKEGLAGRTVTPEAQENVLRRLEAWIKKRFGSLDVERDSTDRYELAAIRLPSSPQPTPRAEKGAKHDR